MHSDRAAVPPGVPGPAGVPIAVLASCSVISWHAVSPPPPPPPPPSVAGVAVAVGPVVVAVAGGPAPTGDALAGPHPASNRQPAARRTAFLVLVPIIMISLADRAARRRR